MEEENKVTQFLTEEIEAEVCVCWKDLTVQLCFSWSDSEFGSSVGQHKQRLTLCLLCLLSHRSKSVYSKSLDIPDGMSKGSKEERYPFALPL